jgi:hypothetical protein
MQRRAAFGWSALVGFFVGIALCFTSTVIERVVEGPPDPPTPALNDLGFPIACGVIWAVICAISFPIMWYRIKPTRSPVEVLIRAAIAAFVTEAATLAIYDEIYTRFNVTRWMYDHVNDYVHSSLDMTIFVLPAIIAAYVKMRLVSRRSYTNAK